ncbi:MAG: hypothetical protein KGK30_08570, partial [Elusimicrobia bacterium]|nr:hypothetical protein [Elusimicrobiota bacterium]
KVSLGRFSVSLREMMKWVGAASVAAWTTFVLIPKPALAMLVSWLQPWAGIDLLVAATVGLYLVLHHLTPRLSDSTWMKVEAGALLLIGLPLFFWGSPWALYLSVAVLGFALNGSQRMISATFWSASKQVLQGDQFEYVNGIRQAFFNIAMSLGVALYAVAQAVPALFSGNPHAHAFPFTWYVLAGLFALCAALFVRGSKLFAVEKDKK